MIYPTKAKTILF